MVFFFQCSQYPQVKIYMGRDKFENEELIRWGHPEDVWFHVDHLSSAHVYARLTQELEWCNLPEPLLVALCQLVKHNSLEGCKKDTVDVVYTPWSNLKKESHMAIGQVGFKNDTLVRHVKHIAKDKALIKQLEKSRTQASPNLEQERKERDREEIQRRRQEHKENCRRERELYKERVAENALRSYAALQAQDVLKETNELRGSGTIASCREIEEDFM